MKIYILTGWIKDSELHEKLQRSDYDMQLRCKYQ